MWFPCTTLTLHSINKQPTLLTKWLSLSQGHLCCHLLSLSNARGLSVYILKVAHNVCSIWKVLFKRSFHFINCRLINSFNGFLLNAFPNPAGSQGQLLCQSLQPSKCLSSEISMHFSRTCTLAELSWSWNNSIVFFLRRKMTHSNLTPPLGWHRLLASAQHWTYRKACLL